MVLRRLRNIYQADNIRNKKFLEIIVDKMTPWFIVAYTEAGGVSELCDRGNSDGK